MTEGKGMFGVARRRSADSQLIADSSPAKLNLPEWLEVSGVVKIPAIGLFRVEDEFLSTGMLYRKYVDGIGEVQLNLIFFQEFLDKGGIEESAVPPVSFRLLRLLEPATNKAIIAGLGGETSIAVTIGQIVQFLRQGEFRVGDRFLFFARGRSGILWPVTCTVNAHLFPFSNWNISARQMGDDTYQWGEGWQVVSR